MLEKEGLDFDLEMMIEEESKKLDEIQKADSPDEGKIVEPENYLEESVVKQEVVNELTDRTKN